MQEIIVVSGKGGTGKTTIVAGLAMLAHKKIIVDCAAETPNLEILLNSTFSYKENFFCGMEYYRVEAECLNCGQCRILCEQQAIDTNYNINSLLCVECAACYTACPNKAIARLEKMVGYCAFFDTKYGKLIQAELNPGENSAGKLITQVKKEARLMAQAESAEFIIVDGPSGLGNPVNATLAGANLALVITEPTSSAINDLKRIIEVCQRFMLKIFIVINKSDLNQNHTNKIKSLCAELKISIAGEIQYSELVPNDNMRQSLKSIWQNVTA